MPPLFAFITTFLIGILTGLFGIGGGALMTPLMLIVFRFPPHVAVGTSMMMIFFSSVMSSIGHIAQGHVAWGYAIILIISSYFGAKIGVKVNQSIKSDTVVTLLRNSNVVNGYIFNYSSVDFNTTLKGGRQFEAYNLSYQRYS